MVLEFTGVRARAARGAAQRQQQQRQRRGSAAAQQQMSGFFLGTGRSARLNVVISDLFRQTAPTVIAGKGLTPLAFQA